MKPLTKEDVLSIAPGTLVRFADDNRHTPAIHTVTSTCGPYRTDAGLLYIGGHCERPLGTGRNLQELKASRGFTAAVGDRNLRIVG